MNASASLRLMSSSCRFVAALTGLPDILSDHDEETLSPKVPSSKGLFLDYLSPQLKAGGKGGLVAEDLSLWLVSFSEQFSFRCNATN